ncbi:hypothetical protein [Pediococcus acidilactici]|uniref:hypothetical protein n=2 Tax=Pediococcus acidilactici TaxID=1254 RepID=UPI002B4B97B3|nr:hypothetical protein [Pediococcus acidilactici]
MEHGKPDYHHPDVKIMNSFERQFTNLKDDKDETKQEKKASNEDDGADPEGKQANHGQNIEKEGLDNYGSDPGQIFIDPCHAQDACKTNLAQDKKERSP